MRRFIVALASTAAVVPLAACYETPLCPRTWVGAEVRRDGRCKPPEQVVRAAEAHLTTGIYGYLTSLEASGCGECELVLGEYTGFGLQRSNEDGSFEFIDLMSDREATFEIELAPGVYKSNDMLLDLDRGLPEDENGHHYFVLEQGDVLFLNPSLGCAIRC